MSAKQDFALKSFYKQVAGPVKNIEQSNQHVIYCYLIHEKINSLIHETLLSLCAWNPNC